MKRSKHVSDKFEEVDICDVGLTSLDIKDAEDESGKSSNSIETDISSQPLSQADSGILGLVRNRLVAEPVEIHFATRALARQVLIYGGKSPKTYWKRLYFSSHFPKPNDDKEIQQFKNLYKEVKFILEEIGDRKVALKSRETKYVSFGIGSGSPRPNERNYLKCEDDLKLMRNYCERYNYFLGSTLENGSSPTLAAILAKIRYCCVCAFEIGAHAVLYYSGHADENGNWWFYDGDLSLEMLLQQVNAAKTDIGACAEDCMVYIIADCCFAGRWCQDLSSDNIMIIAAAGERSYSYDETFSHLFFDDTDEKAAVRNVKHLRKEELQSEIAKILPTKAIDRSNKRELQERLLELVTSEKQKLIKYALRCKPTIGTSRKMRRMRESELVERLWFNSNDEEVDWY
eukprot:gene11835-13347_t